MLPSVLDLILGKQKCLPSVLDLTLGKCFFLFFSFHGGTRGAMFAECRNLLSVFSIFAECRSLPSVFQ